MTQIFENLPLWTVSTALLTFTLQVLVATLAYRRSGAMLPDWGRQTLGIPEPEVVVLRHPRVMFGRRDPG